MSMISPQGVSNNTKLGNLSLSGYKILGNVTKIEKAYPDIKTYPVVFVSTK